MWLKIKVWGSAEPPWEVWRFLKVFVHKLITMTNCPSTVRNIYNWQLTSECKCWPETSYSLKPHRSHVTASIDTIFNAPVWVGGLQGTKTVVLFTSYLSFQFKNKIFNTLTKQYFRNHPFLLFSDRLKKYLVNLYMYVATPLTKCYHKPLPLWFGNDFTGDRKIAKIKKKVPVWKSCNSAGCKEENCPRVQPCPVSPPD